MVGIPVWPSCLVCVRSAGTAREAWKAWAKAMPELPNARVNPYRMAQRPPPAAVGHASPRRAPFAGPRPLALGAPVRLMEETESNAYRSLNVL
jgi:hypothetical protein